MRRDYSDNEISELKCLRKPITKECLGRDLFKAVAAAKAEEAFASFVM